MKHLIPILNIMLAAALLSACAGPASTPTVATTNSPPANTPVAVNPTHTPGSSQPLPAGVAVSNKQRITKPAATATDISQLVSGSTAFAFVLYQALGASGTGNLFYSPYSISIALAMAQAGARGDTLSQINQVLHFSLPGETLHQAFNALQLDLANRARNADQPDQNDFSLNIANATWGQAGYQFLPTYLDVLAENYGAGMRLVDFKTDPEKARQLINDWVAQQTAQKIPDLIPAGQLDAMTRLVLTNAIYFKAAWESTFAEKSTTSDTFTNLDGKQVKTPMMRQQASFDYTKGNGYQAVRLPYSADKLSMLVILPDAGKFTDFEKSLTPAQLDTIRKNLASATLNLSLPKFKYTSSFALGDTLQKMGLKDAFNPSAADLSGMDGTRNLSISSVLHKAYVNVDENGTEAAAATAVVIGVTSMPVDVIDFKIDRPFIFLIQDNQTGSILFMGRVVTL